jgi:hypothetical protein
MIIQASNHTPRRGAARRGAVRGGHRCDGAAERIERRRLARTMIVIVGSRVELDRSSGVAEGVEVAHAITVRRNR